MTATDGPPVAVRWIHVGLIIEADDALRELRSYPHHKNMTEADLVNRALQLYAFMERESAAGSQHLIREPDGDLAEVKLGWKGKP